MWVDDYWAPCVSYCEQYLDVLDVYSYADLPTSRISRVALRVSAVERDDSQGRSINKRKRAHSLVPDDDIEAPSLEAPPTLESSQPSRPATKMLNAGAGKRVMQQGDACAPSKLVQRLATTTSSTSTLSNATREGSLAGERSMNPPSKVPEQNPRELKEAALLRGMVGF